MMTSKLSCHRRVKNEDFENQNKTSEKEATPDVFEVFLPSLWTLRLTGMWLPGDLKTATSVRDCLRGSPKVILYLLYCVIVFASTWFQALRFLAYAVKQTGAELMMVLVVFLIYSSPAFTLTVTRFMRGPLFTFTTALNDYFKCYGQKSYIKDMIKTEKRVHRASMVISFLFVVPQFLYLYVFSTTFQWVTTPVDRKAPWYILVPWKLYIGIVCMIIPCSEISNMGILRCISIILRNEFSEFNRVVKDKTNTIHCKGSHRDTTDYCIVSPRQESSSAEDANVTQAPAESGGVEAAAWGDQETENTNVSAEEMDDLRCRFERLVDLVEKGNSVVKVECFSAYILCVPLLCLIIKGLTEAGGNSEYTIFMAMFFIGNVIHVALCSIEAVRINIEAHASCQYLQRISTKHLPEKTIQIINLFVNRLNGPPIGISIGSITIDVSFVTGLIGTLIAYIFVVVEFNSQPSCSVASTPEVFSTASPANVTMATG